MKNQFKYTVIGFFMLMVFSVFSGMVETVFFDNPLPIHQNFEDNWWLLFTSLLIAPIFEEWLFRKVILSKLEKRFSFEMSNVISSLLFAVAHLDWFVLPYFLNGLTYGWVMKKTNKLYSAIILHSLYNAVVILTAINI